eukprot:1143219-Pyramimonas_sp.AAC.1
MPDQTRPRSRGQRRGAAAPGPRAPSTRTARSDASASPGPTPPGTTVDTASQRRPGQGGLFGTAPRHAPGISTSEARQRTESDPTPNQ